jgi:cell division protein FtsB
MRLPSNPRTRRLAGGTGAYVKGIAANLVRVCVTGVVFGFVGVAVIYTAWRFCYPYAEEWQARAQVARLGRRVSDLRAEHQRLQQQAQLLATPEGIKIEARRLGLLKPGERSLRFMTRPESREAPRQEPTRRPGALERLRAWGRGLLGSAEKPSAPDTATSSRSRKADSKPPPKPDG